MADVSTLAVPAGVESNSIAESTPIVASTPIVKSDPTTVSTSLESPVASKSAKKFGMTKLVGVSGIVMASILPIGLVPRFMQLQELNQTQQKIEDHIPAVSTTRPIPAPSERPLNLPGTIEAIV